MEAKGRKMLAIGVIIGLCAVAMIGAAYAAVFGGTAKTYNEDNSATVGYVTLAADGTAAEQWSAITANANTVFSTYTYNKGTAQAPATATAYYYSGGSNITISDVVYYSKSIGTKDYVITNKTGSNITEITFAATPSKAVGDSNFVYIIGVGETYYLLNATTTREFVVDDFSATAGTQPLANDGSYTLTVNIYVGYQYNAYIPTSEIGNVAAPNDDEGRTAPAGYTQAAKADVAAPAGFTDLDFKFEVTSTIG